jgi:hypothetical protein
MNAASLRPSRRMIVAALFIVLVNLGMMITLRTFTGSVVCRAARVALGMGCPLRRIHLR